MSPVSPKKGMKNLDKIILVEVSRLDKAAFELTMDFTSSQYYGVVKKVSSLVGQWPYQDPKTKLICLSLVTLSTFSIIIPQVIDNISIKFLIKLTRAVDEVFEARAVLNKHGVFPDG